MADVTRGTTTPLFPSRVQGCGEMLTLIRQGQAHTIGDLADAMDIARSTVVQRVEHLVSDGLVVADRAASTGRGRPPVRLRFNADGGTVLVAQVGVTGSRVAVADLEGRLLAEDYEVAPLDAGPDELLRRLTVALGRVLDAAGSDRAALRGIGIGWPGSVGLELDASVLPDPGWEASVLVQRLEAAFAAPVIVDEDVNLLALGEHRSGWPTTDVLLCVKVGSFVGCGTVVDGAVVHGAQHVAGRIGHLGVPGDTTPCRCGNVGCLDAVAGGAALVRRLRAAGVTVTDLPHLVAMANEGVPEVAQAVRAAGRQIGEVLSYAVNLLNPGVIAFWGYLVEAESVFLAGVREAVYQRGLPAATNGLQLVRATVGDRAGLVGAATMVVSQVLSPGSLEARLARSSTVQA